MRFVQVGFLGAPRRNPLQHGSVHLAEIVGGKREHHILDPRTGYPTVGVHGVSLLARDVAQVNGLGAAMMVQGPQGGKALVARQPGVEALVVSGDRGAWYSPGMAAALSRGTA